MQDLSTLVPVVYMICYQSCLIRNDLNIQLSLLTPRLCSLTVRKCCKVINIQIMIRLNETQFEDGSNFKGMFNKEKLEPKLKTKITALTWGGGGVIKKKKIPQEGMNLNSSIIIPVMLIKISPCALEKLI